MANSLGALVVRLGLDAAEFVAGMTRAEYQASKALKSIGVSGEFVQSTLKGLAAGLSVGAVAAFGKSVIDAAADLDDMAEKTGASVEELSKLAQQARISGTDLGTVEMGLIRLGKSLNENDEEAKKATKALTALGLSAQELKKLDTAQALKIVAAEMNKFGDSSGKTALALDLFGKSGAQLLPFLKDMANDGELAANVTAKQAAEAEELGKAYRRLINDSRNIGQSFVLDLVPQLLELIGAVRDAQQATGGLLTGLNALSTVRHFGDTAIEQIRGIEKALKDLEKQKGIFDGWAAKPLLGMRESNLLAARETARALQRREALALGGTDTPGELQRFGLPGAKRGTLNYEGDNEAARKKAEAEAKRRAAELKRLDQERTREAEKIAKLQSEGEEQFEKDASDAFKFVADMQRKLNDRTYFENIYGDERLLGMSIEEIQQFHKAVLDGAEAIMTAGDAAMLAYAGFDENGRSLLEKTEKGIDVAKELGLTFTSAFEDAVVGGKKFRDVLEGIAKDIARIILRKQVTEPLANAIGKVDFGELFKGVFGGDSTPAPAPTGDFYGPAATGIDRVPRDGFAFLHKGETVVPEYADRGGSVVINITQDNRGVDPSVISRMELANAQLRREIVPLVQDSSRRAR